MTARLKRWRAFYEGMQRRLLLTNTLTSCTQIGAADVVQQWINGDIKKYGWDWRRSARMAGIGLVIAPMLHGFYRILDTRKFTGSHKTVVLKKLWWDTACMPVFSCTFITVGALYEGHTLHESLMEYYNKMWHIWKVDFSIWPPAQLINFYFLPNSLRVIYINLVSLIYNCVMSYIKNNDISVINKDA